MKPRSILIVDDDPSARSFLSRALAAAGTVTHVAEHAEAALGILESTSLDLILVDVRMPGMSGIELGARLREVGVPFLYLSAYGDRDAVENALEEGALGYLVKPLDIQQIVPSIEAAFTRARDLRRLRETEAQLNAALSGTRDISMAIGLLMMRDRINREDAFELLRANARAQRRTVAEVAGELLASAEKLYTIKDLKPPRRR